MATDPPGQPDTDSPPEVSAEPPATKPLPSGVFRRTMLRGSVHTVLGYGISQAIRFGGNLILVRILFKADFGVMLKVQLFLMGIALFSDLGFGIAVIQNKRGQEPGFLRTVWTMQILRGLVLFAAAWFLAYPLADFFGNPELVPLLQAAASTLLIASITSSNISLLRRKVNIGQITLFEIVAQSAGLVTMIALAAAYKSVWALVIGAIVAQTLRTALSFRLPGPKMAFELDRQIAGEVLRFGIWILPGTALSFLASQSDRAVLTRLLTDSELGVLSIAFALTGMVSQLIGTLATAVLLPAFRQVLQESPPEQWRRKISRLRLLYIAPALPALAVMIFAGHILVDLLYPDNYLDAGRMVRVISIGTAFGLITETMTPVILASGNSRRQLFLTIGQVTFLSSLMLILGPIYHAPGILWAMVLARLCQIGLVHVLLRNERVTNLRMDLLLTLAVFGLAAGMVATFGWW